MVTLSSIFDQSVDEITAEVALRGPQNGWPLCAHLPAPLDRKAEQLKADYKDFQRVLKLSLASYYLSFLVLFFHKQGPVQVDDMITREPLQALLDRIRAVFLAEDNLYPRFDAGGEDGMVAFLNHWLVADLPFCARSAKVNIVLDLLMLFDQRNATHLSGRLLNDIGYVVYSLALHDGRLSRIEKELLDFLKQETRKVKKSIGDTSLTDPAAYAARLESQQSEVLLEQARAELGELIGLDGIKHEIERLEAFLTIQKKREEMALAVTDVTLHFVFRGNPGTGKTTVARILAKLFKGLGFLDQGHLEETDRSGLVAEYLGQTAAKTKAKAEAALGGVLFIDEAYALSRNTGGGAGNDAYGREAIETILKFMEDHRDNIVVIVAGYPRLMNDFIATNPGLKSRFTRYLDFEDFQPVELCQIAQLFAHKAQYHFADPAVSVLAEIFSQAFAQRSDGFGNARFVRNLFEQTLQNQAMRLAAKESSPDKESLMTLIAEDLPKEIDAVAIDLQKPLKEMPLCKVCDRPQPSCPPQARRNPNAPGVPARERRDINGKVEKKQE